MPRPKTLYCIACGYNLTGICSEEQPVGRCPECGERFDRAGLIWRSNKPGPLPRRPIVMLLIWPVLVAELLFLECLELLEIDDGFGGALIGLIFVCGAAHSVYVGWLIVWRDLKPPPSNQPGIVRVVLGWLLAIPMGMCVAGIQGVLFFLLFFVGYLCVIVIARF